MSVETSVTIADSAIYDTIRKFFLDALATRRYQLLKVAYNYKQESPNYNWLADVLFDVKYGLKRPTGHFIEIAPLQAALISQINDLPYALVKDIVERAALATGIRTKFHDRFKQIWTIDQLIARFEEAAHPDWIWWMSTNEFGLGIFFDSIVRDESWTLNINEHLHTLRAAFRSLVVGLAAQIGLDLSEERKLEQAFKKLATAINEQCAAATNLLAHYDFVKRFTKLADAYKSIHYQDDGGKRFALSQALCQDLQKVTADLRVAMSFCPVN